jgi:uncharacterized protein
VNITWDPPKRDSNVDKHGVDFAAIDEAFFATAVVQKAKSGRLKALGWLGGIVIVVVFKPLGAEGLSVLSARPANRKERTING